MSFLVKIRSLQQIRSLRNASSIPTGTPVNLDMTPEIGLLGDERVIYSTGCIGHGVSLTHLNGRLIADLLSGRKTELSDFWIVNRKAIPWPPEPLSFLGRHVIHKGLRLWDYLEERKVRRRPSPAQSG